ncbi:hypothetical protein [Ruminococcus sp.]|uniref:hypothetical protein n=1 Tax=Ruminococcus sp. TaxID=41978 RepID=UPI0025F43B80|nr:hypothetical protein [Ruminococcus sp.]MBQ8967915.1 hypothetical protein [Ruminococcus sp.]
MLKSRKRALSWIVLVVFSLVIFCSSAFIVVHAEHEHTGEDCSVCMELAQCHKTLHTLGTAVSGVLQLTLMLCIVAALCKVVIRSHSEHTTLISLKVELLD